MKWVYRYNGWITEGLDLVVLFVKEQMDGTWAFFATVQKVGTRIAQGYAGSKEAAQNQAIKASRIFLMQRVNQLMPLVEGEVDQAGIYQYALEGNWDSVKATLGAMSYRDVRELGGVVERLEYWVFEELAKRKAAPTPTLPQTPTQKGEGGI